MGSAQCVWDEHGIANWLFVKIISTDYDSVKILNFYLVVKTYILYIIHSGNEIKLCFQWDIHKIESLLTNGHVCKSSNKIINSQTFTRPIQTFGFATPLIYHLQRQSCQHSTYQYIRQARVADISVLHIFTNQEIGLKCSNSFHASFSNKALIAVSTLINITDWIELRIKILS